MISPSATIRLSWESPRIVVGNLVPMPVSVTTPITMPTQAAAATSAIESRAEPAIASRILRQFNRVVRPRALATITTTSARLAARKTV